jgi:hypothetical protein
LTPALGVIDVVQWVDSVDGELGYEELMQGSVTAEPFGVPVTVCSLERLVAMKRRADRDRDRDDLAHLLAD